MFFYRKSTPGLAIYSYIVGDEKSKKCAVIDPVRDVEEYLEVAKKEGLDISDICETHVHADFLSGSKELKARLKNKPTIHCSGEGGKEWTPAYADHVIKNGDRIEIGSILLEAIHTPGHTPEHLVFALYEERKPNGSPDWLFTGDLLFVGDIGRPDLLGKEQEKILAKQLYQTIFSGLDKISDSVEIFPAHGAGSMCGKSIGSRPSSTVGLERLHNPSLVKKSEDVWTKEIMEDMPRAPSYVLRMKKENVEGPPVIGAEKPGLQKLGPKTIKEMQESGAQILDVRSKEAFSAAHVPGSISIPLSPSFAVWCAWVLDPKKPLAIVCNNPSHVPEVVDHLLRVGIDHVKGYMEGGMGAWENQGYKVAHVVMITVGELKEDLEKRKDTYLLDIRTPPEWKDGHIHDAHHIPAGFLQDQIDEIPKSEEISLICGSGFRASIIASLLKREGVQTVRNVLGGMTAWRSQNYPVERNKKES